jgi:hypothetical protein
MGFEIIGMILAGAAMGLLVFYVAKGLFDVVTGKMR